MLYSNYPTFILIFFVQTQRSLAGIPNIYTFTTENVWLPMPDGIRLSATLTIPMPKYNNEKFPVVFEYRPYRKDDNSYNSDQANVFYLTRRGFIVAKVDIRGTGASEGVLIEREYTTQELDDCEHVIEQLANDPRSNGRVGMYGLSWSGFNSLMMATLRRPPALRAVFVAHASNDLYKNDIHYPDGIMHLDHYIVSVDNTNALPATPDYVMNEKWIKERFITRPWSDVYLEHQLDDSFWRKHSIKYAYENFTLPAYLIGGLYDPYKDVALNIYEHAHQISPKIKVVVGPFVHAMPEYTNRNPGPGFDSKAEMVRWFNHWLKDDNENNDMLNEPDITLFIRTSLTTGTYRYEPQWPIPRERTRRMYMTKDRILTDQVLSTTDGTKSNSNNNVHILKYRPWIGFESGLWLGGLAGDQRPFDEYCLVYQSEPVNDTIEIIGFINVSLQVSATAPLAHWIIRFEDVDIDGQVWLVTTGALNGAQRQMPPTNLEPNHPYTITLRLRFTTWTFFVGHRIRVAVSNAMFPTYWPSPFAMNTSLFLNPSATFIDLPIILPLSSTPPPPSFTQQQVPPTDILPEFFSGGKPRVNRKHETNLSTTITFQRINYELLPSNKFISTLLAWNFTCSHLDPADVQWTAQARQVYVYDMHGYASIDDIPMKDDNKGLYPNVDLSIRQHFELVTDLKLHSDRDYFYINFKRQLFRLNETIDQFPMIFTFNNKHKRQFQ